MLISISAASRWPQTGQRYVPYCSSVCNVIVPPRRVGESFSDRDCARCMPSTHTSGGCPRMPISYVEINGFGPNHLQYYLRYTGLCSIFTSTWVIDFRDSLNACNGTPFSARVPGQLAESRSNCGKHPSFAGAGASCGSRQWIRARARERVRERDNSLRHRYRARERAHDRVCCPLPLLRPRPLDAGLQRLRDVCGQVDAPNGIRPFVVVPGHDLHQLILYDEGR